MATLQTENILLRALEPEDLDVLYQWENDTDLWKNGSTLTPYSKFALRDYLVNSLHGIFHSRQLRLMIVEKKSKKTIGTLDLYEYDPIHQRAGIGILLEPSYRHKGFGVETLQLTKDYAFRYLQLKQLYAYIPETNISSYKLFNKCGYVQAGILKSWIQFEHHFEDVFVMQLINDENQTVNDTKNS
jgi:diamine N-acetyltransferase